MKRKLYKQIRHEWRSNLWLAVELVIVSSVLWYIADIVSSQLSTCKTPLGYDTEDVYNITFGKVSSKSASYQKPEPNPGESEDEAASRASSEALKTIFDRLRSKPFVECLAWGSSGPYNYNFWGETLKILSHRSDSLTKLDYNNNIRISADYPKVFKMHGHNGETPQQLSKLIEEGKLIIAVGQIMEYPIPGINANSLINNDVAFGDDGSGDRNVIGAVIPTLRRSEYEPAQFTTTLRPMTEFSPYNVYVRVPKGAGKQFEEYFNSDEAQRELSVGNYYPLQITSMQKIRNDFHRNDDAMVRNMIIACGFLLLTVFLGLFGAFWFRTQQRVKEIAIRKVAGATRMNIFRRLISEGLLILFISSPMAWVIDWLIVHNDWVISRYYFPSTFTVRCILEALGVLAIMVTVIVIGIYFPASKAMKVEPADVLRGE